MTALTVVSPFVGLARLQWAARPGTRISAKRQQNMAMLNGHRVADTTASTGPLAALTGLRRARKTSHHAPPKLATARRYHHRGRVLVMLADWPPVPDSAPATRT